MGHRPGRGRICRVFALRPYNNDVIQPITRRASLPLLLCGATRRLTGEDWPQFRGPDGQGHSAEHALPVTWSEKENIRWKVPAGCQDTRAELTHPS